HSVESAVGNSADGGGLSGKNLMRGGGGNRYHIARTIRSRAGHDDRMRSKARKAAGARTEGHKAGCVVSASAAGSIGRRHIVRGSNFPTAADCVWSRLRISKFGRRDLGDGERSIKTGIAHVGNRQRLIRRQLELLRRRDCYCAVQTLSAIRGNNRKGR